MVRIFLQVFVFAVIFLIIAFFGIGFVRTGITQSGTNEKKFLSGSIKLPLPEGFYKGKVTAYYGSWKGKEFDSLNSSGINVFQATPKDQKLYPFKTFVAKGLRDTTIDVLVLDYNLPENPWWLRHIRDEIVQVDKGVFFGKLFLEVIPGHPFALGYFTLQK